MRDAVFDALRLRFRSNPTLATKSRDVVLDLTDQDRPNVVRPYVDCTMTLEEQHNSFDTDVDEYEVEFRYHAGGIKPLAAHEWLEAIRIAFKDADLKSHAFQCCGIRQTGARGPSSADGGYDAAATFRVFAQRIVRSPLVV